jgi:hypothetical protein
VLLAVSTIFSPQHLISLSMSTDFGNSWAPYSTVLKTPSPDIQINNAFLLELPSGRLLCAFRAHTQALSAAGAEEKPGAQNEGYLYYRLKIYYSDVGETWQYLSTPAQEPGPSHGNWEPLLCLSNPGVLQFYYSRELEGRDQDNLMRVSHDEGQSWSSPQIISGQDRESRDGMLGLQEISPGSGHLMAVFESLEENGDGKSRFGIWSMMSRDDGATWGERRQIYEPYLWDASLGRYLSEFTQLDFASCSRSSLRTISTDSKKLLLNSLPQRNSGAPQIALVGDTLVVSFMTDEDKLEGTWHRNANVKIITSHDKGALGRTSF